ncbi:hypothetical protein ITP53_55330, partial [Nonomuraea sp. K274]
DFHVLVASPRLAVDLLETALAIDPELTGMFRGQFVGPHSGDASMSVADALAMHGDLNRDLQLSRLTPLEQRLEDGLALRDGQIHRIPVLFQKPLVLVPGLLGKIVRGVVHRVSPLTPNMVNSLVTGHHVIVPRPMGPRMSRERVPELLDRMRVPALDDGVLKTLAEHRHWAVAPATVANLSKAFGVDQGTLVVANPADTFEGARVPDRWTPVRIPGDKVDVLEAYVVSVLSSLGLRTHFVDTWTPYHVFQGTMHCATNVKRTPPDLGRTGP